MARGDGGVDKEKQCPPSSFHVCLYCFCSKGLDGVVDISENCDRCFLVPDHIVIELVNGLKAGLEAKPEDLGANPDEGAMASRYPVTPFPEGAAEVLKASRYPGTPPPVGAAEVFKTSRYPTTPPPEGAAEVLKELR
jgi:hypothetical protein